MPVKIGFRVIAVTGEDEEFRATELNYHGPTVRGWRSSANCTFPQEIILQLKVLAILQQIQILAHQYLIPHKIEICTSTKLDPDMIWSSRDLFEYVGFITFSDNKATGFRSRELKSILIPSRKAKYIKLIIHNNHVNVKNVHNQVSLVAVNILGNELNNKTEETEMNNNVSFHPARSYASTLAYNANYLSPYDDLAFQMSVDEETAEIIKIIEYKMLQAAFEERLDYANALKITIENLRAAGEILGIYEQEKKRAISLEDFDKAKAKKIQIDQFRQRIYNTLCIDKLLDETDFADEYDLNSNPEERGILSNESTPRRTLSNGRAVTPNEIIYENTRSPSRFIRPLRQPQMIHSQSQTFSGSPAFSHPPQFCTSTSNPHLHQYLKQVHSPITECCHEYKADDSLNVRTPSSVTDSLTEDELTPPKSPSEPKPTHRWNGSLIPRLEKTVAKTGPPPHSDWTVRDKMKTSNSDQKIRSKVAEASMTKSSFEAYEDRMLPALRSYHGHEVVRECQFAFEQRKTTLNEREKKQAMLPIAVFGIEMIEKIYSKSFNNKEEGLKQLQQELKRFVDPAGGINGGGKVPSYNKIARGAIFLLHRGLRDTVYSVYKLAAETVRLFFAEFVPQRVSPSEVARSVEKLLPELLTKSGDATPRIHNLAAHTILSMAECEEVRKLNIIPTHLSRPLTSSIHPRLALSRLEMVEQLILNHGISKDKKSGLTCRTLAEFGSSGLHHPAEAVRKVSERILIHVYKVNPRIVRKQLPPDDNVTRRNLLYRQLFQEFDFMDVQRKFNEQALDDFDSQYLEPANKQKPNHSDHITADEAKSKPTQKDPRRDSAKPFLPQNANKDKTTDKRQKRKLPDGKKEEKIEEATPLRFPYLTDSIQTAKARMMRAQKKNKTNDESSSLDNSQLKAKPRRDVHGSGIPVPTFGALRKIPAGRRPEKEGKQQLPKTPPKTNKTIRIRMFEPTKPVEDQPKNIKFRLGEGGGMEESVRFSDSMLASIRENELTMTNLSHGRQDKVGNLKMCIFCLTSKQWTDEDSLNRHYLKDCLMLTTCEYCMEVTEISGFTNHLLEDCKWKNLFQKCTNCQEVILRDLYDKHECTDKVHRSRCPFCHKTIGDEETSWRKHLMGNNTCVNHPRQK